MDDVVTVELLVMVDADGNYEVGADEDDLTTRWRDNIADACSDGVPRRVVAVTLKVPRPKPVAVTVVVPPEPAPAVEVLAG